LLVVVGSFEWNGEEEEEGRRGCVKKKKKSRGILVFSHLSDESRGIFVLSRAYEPISSATSSD
jgi:hypothetical protein